jgi:hypothetical protein
MKKKSPEVYTNDARVLGEYKIEDQVEVSWDKESFGIRRQGEQLCSCT